MSGCKTRNQSLKRKRKKGIPESTKKMSSGAVSSRRAEEHFSELQKLLETIPLSSERCATVYDHLVRAHTCCVESEIVCAETLKHPSRLASVVLLLEDQTYADIALEDMPLKRDDCTVAVCQIISHLAAQAEFRHGDIALAQATILRRLSDLLKRAPRDPVLSVGQDSVFRFICEAITNVCREQKDAKRVLVETRAVTYVVRLLRSLDSRVQRAASSVLRTLAFKDDAAKHAIIDSGAIEPLIRMLRSEDHQTHYEAVGTLGNLVHSSPDIKRAVLQKGVLQPVINLLRCSCRDSLREAALLIGQFAQCDARNRPRPREADIDYRVKIVQRGAVPPLIEMLKMPDRSLKEMAAFALGRLAQNSDNQAGIFSMGVLTPLLELLGSGVRNLEHNAAFTLYGLADNVDNVHELVKQGGYEKLHAANFPEDQPTNDCVMKTLKRIAERIQTTEFAKNHLMGLLRSRTLGMKERLATCLVHLLEADDLARAYGVYGGAAVLLDIVCDLERSEEEHALWKAALVSLSKVVESCKERQNSRSTSFVPAPPEEKVYIGRGYVNNPRVHDVVFIVEGEPFYAHKLALSASSETFRAMFESSCLEGGSGIPEIHIPNLSREVLEAMMMFVYTGETGTNGQPAILPDLLMAADQYLLEPLKELCAELMMNSLDPENVLAHYELATSFNATKLEHAALAYIVQHSEAIQAQGDMGINGYVMLLDKLKLPLQEYMDTFLRAVPVAEANNHDEELSVEEAREATQF